MFIELVALNIRRETVTTYCPAAATTVIEGDATRCHVRLLWIHPASVEAPAPGSLGQCKLTIGGKNNTGVPIDVPILTITQNHQIDEADIQEYGDMVIRQMKVLNDSLTVDAILVQTIYR